MFAGISIIFWNAATSDQSWISSGTWLRLLCRSSSGGIQTYPCMRSRTGMKRTGGLKEHGSVRNWQQTEDPAEVEAWTELVSGSQEIVSGHFIPVPAGLVGETESGYLYSVTEDGDRISGNPALSSCGLLRRRRGIVHETGTWWHEAKIVRGNQCAVDWMAVQHGSDSGKCWYSARKRIEHGGRNKGQVEVPLQTPERLYVDGYIFRRESRLCTEFF